MADLFAFWDPAVLTSGGVRYDFSAYVAGRPGEEDVQFEAPERQVSRSESFLVPGQYQDTLFHDGIRKITIPIGIKGSSWDAAVTIWEAIIAQLSVFPQALKMQLSASSHAVFFQILPSSSWQLLYETWDQRVPVTTIRGRLLLEAQPYPIGETAPKTFV